MQEHPVLDQLTIGYSPMIDRQRSVIATRLTIFPSRPDAAPDAAALLRALVSYFPEPAGGELSLTLRPLDNASGGAGPAAGIGTPVLLNIAHEALLDAVLAARPPAHLMVEVPAFMAADPARAALLRELHGLGNVLAIKGRPVAELPRELLPWFRHAIIEGGEERRMAPAGASAAPRGISTVASGVRRAADLDAAFERGAQAALGWPIDDEVRATGKGGIAPDLRGIVELINRVEREEPADRMEHVLKADPTLAFRLMRYINSAAFGLRVEVSSFRHALMLLGYVRLKRWLALLLASGSKDSKQRPLMHAAVRRGLFLEELARASSDEEMRGEMFICGVFSLLDRLMRQPFDELLKNVPVPARVHDSLVGTDGAYTPHLDLVRAIEQGSAIDIRECADRLLVGTAEVNRALFAALVAARELE